MVGVRVKLYSKGSGKWEKSGGEAAKFGLTTTEILEVIRQLQEAGRIDMLKLLHFHIGSQLTDIKRIKNAMKEAARTYAKIRQMGIPIEYLDVGGGMAVDYDGSRTSFESSANYNAREFANDVIYVIKTVCDDENVPHPTIIQESGRYLSAYHAIFVTNVQDEIETVVEDITPMEIDAGRSAGRSRVARPSRNDQRKELSRVLSRRARESGRAIHDVQSRADLPRGQRKGRGAFLGRMRKGGQICPAKKVCLGGIRRAAPADVRQIPREFLGFPVDAGQLGTGTVVSHHPNT